MSSILIVDDEEGIRQVLSDCLRDEGYRIVAAEDGFQALRLLSAETVDLVILDVWLPNMGGIDVLKKIKAEYPEIEVIVISGHGNINLAVQAVKTGAFDFLEKPLSLEKTITVVQNALKLEELKRENRTLKAGLESEDQMIGSSPGMQRVRELIEQSCGSDSRILILGENGTGKELVAREIHRRSRRASGPFVEVNCASIPETLIESELFGHEKGSFTGALARRKGKFELAHRGTLFLDEIADMSLATQAKVLRVIQELKFERIGGEQSLSVDVRLIAATNRHIQEEIRLGRFREDLYFRVNVIPIHVPPLRERLEDLDVLVDYFLKRFRRSADSPPLALAPEAREALARYSWPGNIRELKNFVERVTIMAEGELITPETVRRYLTLREERERDEAYRGFEAMKLAEAKDEFEREFLLRKLEENGRQHQPGERGPGHHPLAPAQQDQEVRDQREGTQMKGLTERQKQVLEFIKQYIRTSRYPPTIREIAEHLEVSVKGAYDHLKALQRKQVIKCNLNRSRAIKLLGDNEIYEESHSTSVPILGAVAAGKPLFAEENMEGRWRCPRASWPRASTSPCGSRATP